MDKLRAITLFCRTVEAKTFAAAAHACDVVPSALSKAIAALERDVGFKLLHRSTRKLSLTEEGSAYYEHCRQLLQGWNRPKRWRATDARRRGGLSGLASTPRCDSTSSRNAVGCWTPIRPQAETLITNTPQPSWTKAWTSCCA